MTIRRGALLGTLIAALASAAIAAGDSLDPKIDIRKADQAHAAAALLKGSDLGTAWAGGPEQPVSLKIPVCPAYHPSYADVTITGHAEAVFTLKADGIQVDSDVQVLASAKQVDAIFDRMLQPKLGACLRYDLLKSIGGTGVKIGRVRRLELAKVGSHAALFRVTLAVRDGKSTVGVESDFMFLGKSRTDSFVNIVAPQSLESQLPALENEIARTIVGRAEV